ncbi:MAG: hypothetical protein HKP58_20420 [Desulfatitalea sp.]|nr:hypothetical protein [Desulfatitalea sp.]NNK02784.1 hypothetical protein [Desulfatitalea sp.]
MSDAEKAAAYGQKSAGGVWNGAVGDLIGLIKGFPGFYAGYLKTLWRAVNYPRQAAPVLAQAIHQGEMTPIGQEIDRLVAPVSQTYGKAMEYKAMLQVLFGEPELTEILYDFAARYWQATHPLERTEMAAEALSDVAVTIILALVTVGTGATAKIALKSKRLVKAGEQVRHILSILKKTGPRPSRLPKRDLDAVGGGGRPMPTAKKAKGMPEPGAPAKKPGVIDDSGKKGYGGGDDLGGPKKTPSSKEIIRRDNNPYDSKGRSGQKSHVDKNGDLVPASPEGKATVEQHIRGAEPAKSDSPYTSFSADPNTPKSYGNKKITVDSERLQKDIDSGKLKDVEIIEQDKIGDKLQKKIDQAQTKYDNNPSKKNSKLLERRKMDLKNTQRDKEILIKGKVLKKYIKITSD